VSLHHESAGNVTMDFKEGGRTRDISKKDSDEIERSRPSNVLGFISI